MTFYVILVIFQSWHALYYLLYHSRLGAPVPVDDGERERDGGQGRDPHLPHLTQRGVQGDHLIV